MCTVAVIRFPGSNCEVETAIALQGCGFSARVFNWNETEPLRASGAKAYVLPGGFSFQDRIRAGVIAARERIMDIICQEAEAGKPVLGICNGAQILLESGLVPGFNPGAVEGALAANHIPGRSGYLSRWVFLKRPASGAECPWLCGVGTEPMPVPVAHAEGRFVFEEGSIERVRAQLGLVYCSPDGDPPGGWPENPNGSVLDAAAVMNSNGNVLAMMPHPERAIHLWQVPPALPGQWGEARRHAGVGDLAGIPGPGSAVFRGLAEFLGVKK